MTKTTMLSQGAVSPADQAANRHSLLEAADHARSLLDAMVRLEEDTPVAPELARRLESVLELLSGHVQPAQAMVSDMDMTPGDARNRGYQDRTPVSGALNPMAPPIQLSVDTDNRSRTATTLGLAYQGPPGRVHGGWVATLLDHIMGHAAATVGTWVYTRSLTVEYDHAVPLFEELDITAQVDHIDGRKIWVVGEIRAAGAVVARAKGLWLPPRVIPNAN